MIAVDRLTTVDRVKAMLGQPLSYTAQDFFLNMLIIQVSAAITRSCNRTHWLLSNSVNPITQIYSGTGEQWMFLDQWPIYCPFILGNTTNGSPTVTGLTTTQYLFVNQSVTGAAFATPQPPTNQPSPALCIQSVDSATQVTLTGAATATTTQQPIGFGVAVWLNPYGYGEQGSFSGVNMLGEGSNYWIDRDTPNMNESKSAGLGGIPQVWPGSGSGWGGGSGGGGYGGGYAGGGPYLSSLQGPGQSNVQVQANIGLQQVPPDLEMAAIWAVSKARIGRTFGMLPQSESDDGYSYSLAQAKVAAENAVQLGLLDGNIAATLSHWRADQWAR
jgi:hypothetical protein